jgi:pimeloyl-ACP methyl ester carboxylesterase
MNQLARLAETTARAVRYPVTVQIREEQLELWLRRLGKVPDGAPAVLLLHGANSSSDTFLIPNGGLASYLKAEGFDVWLLDWRGSPHVLPRYLERIRRHDPFDGDVLAECRHFTYDRVAEEDLREALRAVRRAVGPGVPLSIVGHCVAGGITAIATAKGVLDEFGVSHAVLVALGLFYEVPWDGWIKVEDFILERVLAEDGACRSIDPRDGTTWPGPMDEAYRRWPCPWLPRGRRSTDELLRRLTFMFGKPWNPEYLEDWLDGPILDGIFGPMHLGFYLHSGQMVRRGFAAPFGEGDTIDRGRLTRTCDAASRGRRADYLIPDHYKAMWVTLVTGAENRVWHRDSMDLMYEWLRGLGVADAADRYRKCIVPDSGLQDLFWKKGATARVGPLIRDGLER